MFHCRRFISRDWKNENNCVPLPAHTGARIWPPLVRAGPSLSDTDGSEFSPSLVSKHAAAKALCSHPRLQTTPPRHHPPRHHRNTATMADNDSPVTLRTRKFIRNPLLGRKQMVV